MLFHATPLFNLYIGSAEEDIDPDDCVPDDGRHAQQRMGLHELHIIKKHNYHLTSIPRVGIGIHSNDNLPIIIYDTVRRALCVIDAHLHTAHANQTVQALEQMQRTYNSKPEHLKIFFCPSIKSCCYRLNNDEIDQLELCSFADEITHTETDGMFCDVPLLHKLQLEDAGVPREAFKLQYNVCTCCTPTYHSYHRTGSNKTYQLNIACLR